MSSFLIRDAIVIDGTGEDAFVGDVIVEGDTIAEMRRTADLKDGETVDEAAKRLSANSTSDRSLGESCFEKVIDAEGLVVSPGFIDIHTHSDLSILAAPDASSKVLQGVTTDVTGNCSIGPAPLDSFEAYGYFQFWRSYESSWLRRAGVRWPMWRSWPEYSEVLEEHKKSINIAGLVAHGPVRASVVGVDDEPAAEEQMSKMIYLIEEAMEAGAFGFSTGLTYRPSRYADTSEVVELVRAVSRRGGFYSTHVRGEDDRLLDAVEEALTIGSRTAGAVQISHHKAAGKANWGTIKDSLECIRKARDGGLDVAVDVYPYRFGGTYPGSLQRLLPQSMRPDGDNQKEVCRPEIAQWLRENSGISDNPGRDGPFTLRWDDIYVVEHPDDGVVGCTVSEIASEDEDKCVDWYLSQLGCEKVKVKRISMSEEDVRTVLSSSASMVGSDTYAMNDSDVFSATWLHPRNFGAFARVLEKYVRDEGVLGWEQAVNKMTQRPALRLGLSDRGVLRAGMKADLSLFSPNDIEERASVGSPFEYAAGMEWVFVNGTAVVAEGQVTGNRPGQLLRKTD